MKVEIKYQKGRKWAGLPIEGLVDMSIIEYMVESNVPIVAALYEDDSETPIAYISNDDQYVEDYKEYGFSAHAKDLQVLFCGSESVNLVAKILPEAGIIEITTET